MDYSAIITALIPSATLSVLKGSDILVTTPIDGTHIASLRAHNASEIDQAIKQARDAFHAFRQIPAPKRGILVRHLGSLLRQHKDTLAQLVTLECGKILEEAKGEVQEMIDICDFAQGLSRQLHGLTIASERPEHSMQENWHPLGVVAIITAFNFPVAVWAWNAALALVCGNSLIWKPSEKTPLTALACQHLFDQACSAFTKETGIDLPAGLNQLLLGHQAGEQLVQDPRIALVSATGSTRMGRVVAPKVAERFGKSLLELGGNNAVIVTPSAALDIAIPSIVFGAVGTAGQRCTTTRRLLVHHEHIDVIFAKLQSAYQSLTKRIGSPLDSKTLIGPLIDQAAYDAMQQALQAAKQAGGIVMGGERVLLERYANGYYVTPALVKLEQQAEIVKRETFAPILYVMPYRTLEEALELHNDVPQGLSSAIFTRDISEAEYFKQQSDCGIANVNIGTSGAEIGGAFGGEKETGGGRESGSDAWKYYMRRQTSTTYYGTKAPALAQGIVFE